MPNEVGEVRKSEESAIWHDCRRRDAPFLIIRKGNSQIMRSWCVDLWCVDRAGLYLKQPAADGLDKQLVQLFQDMAKDTLVSSRAKSKAWLCHGGRCSWSGWAPTKYAHLMVSVAGAVVSDPWNWEVAKRWEGDDGVRVPGWLQDLQLQYALR